MTNHSKNVREKIQDMQMERIAWVDMIRGYCMLAVLWFHTEVYYAGEDVIPYGLYVGDVLATFFFLAGYVTRFDTPINHKMMLWSVFRWLFVPYLVFTSLIAYPKALVHHSSDSVWLLVANILLGHASWFISALIIAKLLYISITFLFKPLPKTLAACGVLALLATGFIGNAESPWFSGSDFWCINEGLLGFTFMVGGMLFRRYEASIVHRLYNLRGFVILFALVIILKYIVLATDAKVIFGPVMASNYPLFLIDLAVNVLLLVGIFMKMPYSWLLEWVGRRSIVYYFFCGGCPLLVSSFLNRIGFGYTCYAQIPIAYALQLCLSTVIVFFVYRYTNIVRKVNK